MKCSLPLTSNGTFSTISLSPPILRWGMQNNQDVGMTHLVTRRNNGTSFQALVVSGKGNYRGDSKSDVIMVDPLEAKRLAAKQMEEIQAEEKFQKQRRIEAINGAWAMIGLTAGLVIEARTGDSIPAQLMGYGTAIIDFFVLIVPADVTIFVKDNVKSIHW
ncbi:hypothetical protein ACHQM5_030273 [Ranunculus cassubicifolius]